MPKQILVRNIPDNIRSWIDQERHQHRMSQQEFVLSVLERASDRELAVRMPLFAGIPEVIETPAPESIPFRFVDLFAGIGGFRVALQKLGGKCVFSSEWDRYAQKTYKAWFDETPAGVSWSELIVAGGGAQNPTLLKSLRAAVAPLTVRTSDELGIPVTSREAVAFAILGAYRLRGKPNILPGATGASRAVSGGAIHQP